MGRTEDEKGEIENGKRGEEKGEIDAVMDAARFGDERGDNWER